MYLETTCSKFIRLSFSSKTYHNFDENIQFSITPEKLENGRYNFSVEYIKGDFKIMYIYSKGKCSDFNHTTTYDYIQDIKLELNFTFEHPSFSSNDIEKTEDNSESSNISNKNSFQDKKGNTNLHEEKIIYVDNRYTDVILISSDSIQISSHRCVLAKHSKIFEKIFETSENLPVIINIIEFDAETIKAALKLMNGGEKNCEGFDGNETEVLKFAIKYDIPNLMEICCSYFVESVDPWNAREIVLMAYSNGKLPF